jgi:hypothetical protein
MSAAPAAAPSPASDSTGRTTQTQQQPQQPEAPTATTAAAPSVTAAVVASSSSNAVVSIPPSPYLINILPLITGASSSLASSDPDQTAAYPSASLLVPPLSFALVCPGVYRSACPSSRNLAFLQGLALKSVVYLCKEEYPSATKELLEKEVGVEIKCFPLSGESRGSREICFCTLIKSC